MLYLKSTGLSCLFVMLSAIYAQVKSQTNIYNTVNDGNWTASSTWQNGNSGKPPISGNCDCIININAGNRLTVNQNVNISNAKIVLVGAGSELKFSSEILFAQTIQLTGNSSIEIRDPGASIESRSNFFGFNGNSISINGTVVFQGYSTQVNSVVKGVVGGPASVSSAVLPLAFINAILPVKLIEFSARPLPRKTLLQWKTAEQVNFDRFEIERSLEGKQWSKIGTVKGVESILVSMYSFTDLLPDDGTNYYRLKMVDIDGQFKYGSIAAANINMQNEQIKVYPNPASSVVYISNMQVGDYSVQLFNQSGQAVLGKKYSSQSKMALHVESVQKGMYFLNITDGKGFRQNISINIF
jgi:hypothetical protein